MGSAGSRTVYAVRRLGQGAVIILGITVADFLLLQLAPGDAVDVLAGESGSATPEYLAHLRHVFGLDQPIYMQLLDYVKNILTLNLGYSFRHNDTVLHLILTRLGPTLLLMGTTIVLSIAVGMLLGLIAAMRPNSWRDNLISVLALLSYATPLFWVGLMLMLVFALKLGWVPTSGMENVAAFYTGWDAVFDVAHHLILPATTLSLFYLALYVRLMRSAVLEQTTRDYVTTARAKGLTERRIMFRHILRNACLPVITIAGVQIGNLIGGSVIVESVFAWPGFGSLAFEALFTRDLNLLMGIFFISACLVVGVNILVDLLYTFLDPRIAVQ